MENIDVRNLVISKSFLDTIALDFIIKYDLRGYVNDIKYITNSRDSKGSYDLDKKNIELLVKLNDRLYSEEIISSSLFILYHELTHAYQYKIVNSRDENIYRTILKDSFDETVNGSTNYKRYYSYFPNEHQANAWAMENSIQFLDDSDIMKSRLLAIALLKDYKMTFIKKNLYAPTYMFYDKCNIKSGEEQINMLFNNNLSNYDRLRLGLPISDEVYNYVYSIIKKKDKNIDTESFIKVLK